jgi:hypothetical protein
MKFFTPDLLERFGSEGNSVALEANRELEERSEKYLRHLQEIAEKLPPRLRELLERFYLHDSRVISHSSFVISDSVEQGSANRSEKWRGALATPRDESGLSEFLIVLQLDTPPGEALLLRYRSAVIEEARLHQTLRDEHVPYLEWLHDEVELISADRDTEFRHSILFATGLELRLRFKDFDYATLKLAERAPHFTQTQLHNG